MVKPGSKWFFIAADYAFGAQLVADGTSLVEKGGGKVIGSVKHPFNFAGDFSPFLLQAQASGADVIAIGSTGTDLVNVLKQAREFGIGANGGQTLASFVLTVPDIAALGLPTAQGVTVNEAFYWDLDDGTRSFATRFMARHHAAPSTIQAGVYSVTYHYLKSVAAAGTTDTAAVMKKMHELPVQDPTIHNGTLRPGRAHGARHLPVPGQDAGREQGAVRLLHACNPPSPPRMRSGRSRKPPARR